MKTTLLLLTLVGSLSSPWIAHSLSTPAWIETTSDIFQFRTTHQSTGPNTILVQRTYHSQSLHRGLLGAGWCLEFDKVITHETDGSLHYNTCEFDRPIQFWFDADQLDRRIYRSTHNHLYTLEQKDHVYILKEKFGTGAVWMFNQQGQLTHWRQSGQSERRLNRNQAGFLQTLILGPTQAITIEQNRRTGFIDAFKLNGQTIFYSYQGHQLTTVRSPEQIWHYRYDETDNLIFIKKGNAPAQQIVYNIETDSVIEVQTDMHRLKLDSFGRIDSIESAIGGLLRLEYNDDGVVIAITNQTKTLTPQTWGPYLQSVTWEQRKSLELSLSVASSSRKNISAL
jgi:hypothetical protein